MKLQKILIWTWLILISLSCVSSFDWSTMGTTDILDRDHGIPSTDWYDVEEWEITFCLTNDVYNEPSETNVGNMVRGDSSFSHSYVATIQAEVNEVLANDDLGIVMEEKLYELSWFVRAAHGETLNYEVRVSGLTDPIVSGPANYANPGRDYWSYITTSDLKTAKLKIWNEDISETIEVTFEGADHTGSS
ncbi:hypothetical protein HN587_06250 [Candidatus Woesearchaeota archaeon]|jgi:hypothetical protein|nr:hypothetical protein [Candidatus Woesearchaeota archaeon]